MLDADWGKARRDVAAALDDAKAADVAVRIWRRDASLWSESHSVQRSIANRLGWLEIAEWSREHLAGITGHADAVAGAPVALLGMGGSSLAPEVVSAVNGRDLTVLDSTDPTEIVARERALPLDRTRFIVASKSGETIETRSHAAFFLDRTGAPERFTAITDPGSALEELAAKQRFARAFLNPQDVGGRYSALSYFGLVPSASIGVNVEPLLDSASEAMELCRASDGVGTVLGAGLAALARDGRDKVTFVASPGLESFGAWAEQLLAESTGKESTGLVPVDGEPVGTPDVYGDDRVFVSLRLAGDDTHAAALAGLRAEGHPVLTIDVASKEALGGQFFLWEFATAVAGWRLALNPFDEPNVAESKQNTARLIEAFVRDGSLPGPDPVAEEDGVLVYDPVESESATAALDALFGHLHRDRYVALQAFLPRLPDVETALRGIRTTIRDARRFATTVGFGPRYLHSTGQLHKGGPDTGLFIQLTAEHDEDLPIPGKPFTFGVLQAAQAAGDFEALASRGRKIVRLHLTQGCEAGLAIVARMIRDALPR
ncbi:MAG: bifunctional transaldolase/phosoglucose isomerase [Actinomycetota bacterium]